MQFTQETDPSTYAIRSYGPGEIILTEPLSANTTPVTSHAGDTPLRGKHILQRSAIVTPTRLVSDWPPQIPKDLCADHMLTVAALNPEIVLIGTGESLCWPDRDTLRPLHNKGIGYEIMNTAAACRTYNILMYEGRGVAAALMMI